MESIPTFTVCIRSMPAFSGDVFGGGEAASAAQILEWSIEQLPRFVMMKNLSDWLGYVEV